MKILRNSEIQIDKWKKLLSGNPYSSPFQTPDFYTLFNSVPGLSAEAVAVVESGSIKALAVITLQSESGIKGFFSRRAIIYGGPLIDEIHSGSLEILLRQVTEIVKRKTIYIETRNFADYSFQKDVFIRCGYNYMSYLNFRVSTADFKTMCEKVSNSRMRQIRKAIKRGVTWKTAIDQKEVRLFYEILSFLYKRKIGKPLLPFEFFKNFFESGLGKYLLIWYNNKIIGGIMCPLLENKTIYEFYVCGLDDEYKEQFPSVMATWAAMEYANQNGILLFDFMGAGKPDKHYGVRDFKARFGGKEVEYGRFLKVTKPILYVLGKSFISIRQKIK